MTPQISAHAETRRSDYQFERAQSREMAMREWEAREPAPIQGGWGWDIAAAIATLMFCALVWPVVEVVTSL